MIVPGFFKLFIYMLIYEKNGKVHCYIHIPKNSGRFHREEILNNKENTIIKSYWGCMDNMDYAHIPFILKDTYISSLK